MPERTIKAKPKGSSGGGSKGLGIGQSVLEMQKQVAAKTVLGPEVASQFSGMVAKTKGGPLFFTTSTYKQLSKLLAAYAAKQGSKSGAWRQGQVGTIDGLLDSWFSKKKNIQDTSPTGEAKRAAMAWLQPKVKSELGALNGVRSEPAPAPEPEPAPEEAPPSWQNGAKPGGGGGTGPTIGKRGWTKGTGGGERGGLTIGGGREKTVPEVEPEPVPEVKPPVPALKPGYVVSGTTEQLDDDDDLSISSAESKTRQSEEDPKDAKVKQLSASSSAVSKTNPTDSEPEKVIAKVPPAKYKFLKSLESDYDNEFEKGSQHLVDVYKVGRPAGPDRENIAQALLTSRLRWKRSTFDKYWDRVYALFSGTEVDDELSLNDEDSKQSDSQKSDSQKSGSQKSQSQNSKTPPSQSSKSSETRPSDSQQNSKTDSQSSQTPPSDEFGVKDKDEDDHEGTDDTITVKKKSTEEERAKYKLQLGGTILRGPEKETLDTGAMATNASGPGFGIFVMSGAGEVYVGSHKVAIFHHSSLLAGAKVAGAGEMKVQSGKLVKLTNKSGHYQPTHVQNMQVIEELKANGISPSSYAFKYFGPNHYEMEYDTAQQYIESNTGEHEKVVPKAKPPRAYGR